MPASLFPAAAAPCPGDRYIGDLGRSGLDLLHWQSGSATPARGAGPDLARSWTDGRLGLFVHQINARNLQIVASATDDLIAIAIPLENRPDRTLKVGQISREERPQSLELIALPRQVSINIAGAKSGMNSITLLVRISDLFELCGPTSGLPVMIAHLLGDHRSMIRSYSLPYSAERIAREIMKAARDGRFSPLFCRSKSAELLNALLEFWISEEQVAETVLCSDRERLGVLRVRDRIESDPVNMAAIDDLARVAGMNRTKLRCLFKQIYGTTMLEFRTSLLMNRADAMLHDTDLPVAEISFRLGYAEASSFNTAYRRFFGHTPGRARRTGHPRMNHAGPAASRQANGRQANARQANSRPHRPD